LRTIGATRVRGVFRAPGAAVILGADHPLARTATLAHSVARQVAATWIAVAAAVLAVISARPWGWSLFAAALVVELTLLGIFHFVRQVQREHVLRLIASGRTRLPLEEVSREAMRLASPRHVRQLAVELKRTFDDAERWDELAIAFRPPAATRMLRLFAFEVDAILAQLRGQPGLPGLASLELLLIGGPDSALYSGDENALREQLRQLRCLLDDRPREQESEGCS
jgi:hypothetical protein